MPQNGSRSGRRRALKACTRDRPFVLSARAFPGGVLRVIDDGPRSPPPSPPPPRPPPHNVWARGGGPPGPTLPPPRTGGLRTGPRPAGHFRNWARPCGSPGTRGGGGGMGRKKKKQKRKNRGKKNQRTPSMPAARPHRPALPRRPLPSLGPSPQPPRPDPSLPGPAARSGATRPPSSPSLLPLSCRKRPFPLCLRRDAAKPSGAGPGPLRRRRQPPSRRKAAGGDRGTPSPPRPARSPPGFPPHLW